MWYYVVVNNGYDTNAIMRSAARHRELSAVSQRAFPWYEIMLYALVPLLLIMAGAMPSTAVFIAPAILVLLYLLYRRFGVYLPLSCIIFYGVFSLVFNFDLITVVALCFLLFAFVGVVFSVQLKNVLLCAVVAAVFGMTGMGVGVGFTRAAAGEPLKDGYANYLRAEIDDDVIWYFVSSEYDGAELPATAEKLKPSDEGYRESVIDYIDVYVEDEILPSIAYYCVHFGCVYTAVAFLFALYLNRRSASGGDDVAELNRLNKSVRSMGGVRRFDVPISSVRLPRAYLWTVLLPAFVVALVLELVGGFDMLTATLMHAFITIPTAFDMFTLLCYFASKAKGKGRPWAFFGAVAAGVLSVVFPIGLLVLSLVGVCDIILNLRYWVEYLSK